jgi:hypothetical protein
MGEWMYNSFFLTSVSFKLQKSPPVSIGYDAGWTPEPLWTLWNRIKSASTENRTPTFQPVARRHTGWGIHIDVDDWIKTRRKVETVIVGGARNRTGFPALPYRQVTSLQKIQIISYALLRPLRGCVCQQATETFCRSHATGDGMIAL